jgi:transposase-like protein
LCRHDPEKLRRLTRRREIEGLSYAQLAKETGIPVGTLAWWTQRLRQEKEEATSRSVASPDTGFVEVLPRGDIISPDQIEVRLPGGVTVQVPSGIDRPGILRLLSAILSC